MRKRNIVAFIAFVTMVINIWLFSQTQLDLFLNFVIVAITVVISSIIAGFIKVEVKKTLSLASEKELEIEDSVLLRGVGFFQSIAFIYLNFMTSGEELSIQKLLIYLIPIGTGVFFTMRGYGAIKRNKFWRLFSSVVLIWFVVIEVLAYIAFVMNITPQDVRLFYIFVGFLAVSCSFTEKLLEILATRYGYDLS